MYDEMKSIENPSFRYESAKVQTNCTNRSIEIQTEIHPILYNKPSNYTFSKWKHRQRAIQMANIRNCRTHSTQTNDSSFRFNMQTQTFLLDDKSIQSGADVGLNTIAHTYTYT